MMTIALLPIGLGLLFAAGPLADAATPPEASLFANDGACDKEVSCDELVLMGLWGRAYVVKEPQNEDKKLAFYLDNIEKSSSGMGGPDGEEVNPISPRIIATGNKAIPATRHMFRSSLAKPELYHKAQLLAYVLGRFRDPEVFDDLAQAALDHPSYEVRLTATWAIARCGEEKALPILIELLHPHPTRERESIELTAAAQALSAVTGKSFPLLGKRPFRSNPSSSAPWQEVDQWRDWGNVWMLDAHPSLSEQVKDALEKRRTLRAHR
jgi:hypothetical protein